MSTRRRFNLADLASGEPGDPETPQDHSPATPQPVKPAPTEARKPATPQPDDTVALSTRIRPALRRRLKAHAATSEISVQEIVEAALTDYLDRHSG